MIALSMLPKVAIAPRRSVAFFALLTLVMVFASYLVVIFLAALCVYLPYWIISNVEHPSLQIVLLVLGGVVIAGALLWSLIPRREKLEAPGPLLQPELHPRLFQELQAIAHALNEPLPKEVYLIGDVNAYVADRGGFLGFGSHRIMAVGLPLLSTLTISEFRGVLAHEFAHFYSGDTSIGPWVYRTQRTMIRTFQNIGSVQSLARVAIVQLLYSIVAFLLKHYFLLFLRVTNFVSRKKEYRADELACLVAGAAPLQSGLKKIRAAAMSWMPYWDTEVVPILDHACRPDIADGFARFIAAPEIAAQIEQGLAKEMAEGKTEPFDTHPPLRDRLTAIQRIAGAAHVEDSACALSLLHGSDGLEMQFLEFFVPKLKQAELRRVGWDALATMVTIPSWNAAVAEYASLLQGITPELLPGVLQNLPELGKKIRDPKGMLLTPQQRTMRAAHLMASALSLALLEKGWQLQTQPGQFYFYRDQEKLNIFSVVQELAAGKLSADVWAAQCSHWGITGLHLAPQVNTAAVAPVTPAS